ncbi:hypothetical protein O181_070631 [Austropuccinia psidii MF-1]|uniref:Uncharacterized protein n=1 Tax=Austropuccinia psidii MF-1 TaxID=1389203 RepID=A0A9Q3F5R9_9BASI|nr:hypothetical protein [Austropuccinia psidii MF-1]
MEYSRTPTSFKSESCGDITVPVQELVHGSQETTIGDSTKPVDEDHKLLTPHKETFGLRKDPGPLQIFDPSKLHRAGEKDKEFSENQNSLIRGPEKGIGPRKEKDPYGSPPSLHQKKTGETSPKKRQANLKEQSKGKGKFKWNKPYPQNYRNPKRERTAMDNVLNMERTLMEFK